MWWPQGSGPAGLEEVSGHVDRYHPYNPVMGLRGPKPGDEGYRPPRDVVERIKDRIVVTPAGCWEWQGTRDAKGYGSMTVGSRVDGTYQPGQRVHRIMWLELCGPIPAGMTIDHTCENEACQNVEHMELVTRRENIRRRDDRAGLDVCRRGHPWTPENTYVQPKSGRRACRACIALRRK